MLGLNGFLCYAQTVGGEMQLRFSARGSVFFCGCPTFVLKAFTSEPLIQQFIVFIHPLNVCGNN